MKLLVTSEGTVRCVYAEALDLTKIGTLLIIRGSHVEPNDDGQWHADLSTVGGPMLGPFVRRSDALAAETDWLEAHWLPGP